MHKPIDAPKIKADCRYYINDNDVLQEFFLIGRHPLFPNTRVVAINTPLGDDRKIFKIEDWENLPQDRRVAFELLIERLKANIGEIEEILNS